MKTLIPFLLFIYSTILYSQENSLLWEIKGNGLKKPSYLYGTFHSKDSRAHQFGDSVLVKLSKSDVVVVENIDIDNINQKDALSMAMMKDNKLEDFLSHDEYIFVKEKVTEKMGDAMGTLCNTMKPIFTVTLMGITNSPQEMPYMVDDFIKREALRQKKNLIGLETAEEVKQSLNEIPLKEQSKMLLNCFKNYDKNLILSDSFVKIYLSQDLNKLYSFYMNSNDVPFSFDKNLVLKRNNKFIDRLIPLINKQSVFCAVGALHLPGETGLINALRKKGYEVSPVYSKYTYKPVYIEDKREWYSYTNDSLYLSMSFPNDPSYELKTFSIANTSNISGIDYNLVDSLYQLKYMVTIIGLPNNISKNSAESTYESMIAQLSKAKKWKKIKENDIEYQELPAKDVEFNISSGINIRYKIVIKGGTIYLFGVAGFKDKLYSNISEHFFEGMFLSNCSVEVQLDIEDNDTHKLLNDFQISISSNGIDTIIQPDTIGKIDFTLPSKESEYTIKVISKNYVTKKIKINTTDINKTGYKLVVLPGTTSMIKIKKGVDYSIFDKPFATAYLINDTLFRWDFEYITKMKEEIDKQFPTSPKTSK